MATPDTYLQQVHSARTQLLACFKRAHEILADREADLLRQLDDIQTSYEQERKSCEEEIQDLEKSKIFLNTSLHDNDTLNKALSPLNDKLEQILRVASAARTVKFQWNTAFDEDLHLAGEIITTSSVPQAVIPHINLTPVVSHATLTPVIHQTTIPHSNLTPVIPQTTITHTNLTPVIPQTIITHTNLTPVIPQTTIPSFTPSIPDYRNKSRPVISCCTQGTEPGQLIRPEGLTIEPQSGRIFIINGYNNGVQVYTPDGQYCYMFDSHMDWPMYICINIDTVYVSQFRSNCITLYKLDGAYLNKIGSEGTSNGMFKSPRGIAVSATSEHLYVCDAGNNRVQIFNKSLKFHLKFGNNTLNGPRDIKLSNDSVIVLDTGNPCIHIFSITNFSLLNSIISRGTADTLIGDSYYFTMDAELNIILTDNSNHCIKVFQSIRVFHSIKVLSKTGHFIAQIGKEGQAIGEFIDPTGIAIDRHNRIIVVSNNKNYSLQIF